GAAASALILACDLPFLTSEFLSFLCKAHQAGNPQSAIRNPQSITVPTDQEGRLQPLVAIYDRACLPAIEEMLAGDQLKVDLLFGKVSTEIIGYEKFSALPEAENLFSNINSPAERGKFDMK
ncbi:MAG: NTP transferase domain-containing protein, partial [Acidobacteriota bacterium]